MVCITAGSYHPAPDTRGVHHGLAAVDRFQDIARDAFGLAGERWWVEPGGHAGLDESRLDDGDAQAPAVELVVDPLQVVREAGFGSAVENHRLAAALALLWASVAKPAPALEGVFVLLTRNVTSEVLLIKRRDGRWDLPGGRPAAGEVPLQTVQREAREELGELPPCVMTGPDWPVEWTGNGGGRRTSVVLACVLPTGARFVPALGQDGEARAWAWASPARFAGADYFPMHPRVSALLATHPDVLRATRYFAWRGDAPTPSGA